MHENCFQTQTTRNGITAQLTFVGAERRATATQQSCTEVFVFIAHQHIVSRDIVLLFQSVRLSARDVIIIIIISIRTKSTDTEKQ